MNESESVAGQMGGYVAEAFFTYEQMRDQRDQALGRAEVAEQELAAAEAEIELLAKCQAFALWVSELNGSNPMLRRRVSLDDIVKRAIAALINGDES